MRNAWIWIVVVVLVIGGIFLWWQSSQSSSGVPVGQTPTAGNTQDYTPPETTPPPATATNTTSATNPPPAASTAKEFTVANKGFSFTPNTLSVKKGDTVKVTFNNTGGTHDLRVEGYDVGTKVIQSGQSDSFTFTADKAGSFAFYCSVGNHRAMGMEGTLTVTP